MGGLPAPNGWSMYHGVQVGFGRIRTGALRQTLVRTGRDPRTHGRGWRGLVGRCAVADGGQRHRACGRCSRCCGGRGNRWSLFQIWLSHRRAARCASPFFDAVGGERAAWAFWRGRRIPMTEVRSSAGQIAGLTPSAPPPDSWATRRMRIIGIFTLKLDPGAEFTLPPAAVRDAGWPTSLRATLPTAPARRWLSPRRCRWMRAAAAAHQPGKQPAELLVLQGRADWRAGGAGMGPCDEHRGGDTHRLCRPPA